MPMRLEAVNKGWKPDESNIADAAAYLTKPIRSMINTPIVDCQDGERANRVIASKDKPDGEGPNAA